MPPLAETTQRADLSSWIEIRLERFRHNLNALKKTVGPAQVMAVVKANAYGHGLAEMARAIQNEVAYLGVSSLYEIMELKEHGVETPIFLFGRLFGQELLTAAKSGATLSLSSYEEAQEIAQAAHQTGRSIKVHIKIDTGMGRLGIPEREAAAVIEKISGLKRLMLEGIYTHFPVADRVDGFTEFQFRKFERLIAALEKKGFLFALRHAANSAASLRLKSPVLNMIRPGLILYGITHSVIAKRGTGHIPGLGRECDLSPFSFQPVLSLKSRIILLKRIMPGDSVGYGREFRATESCTIATLPIGYSHGYPFHLSGKSSVLYRGKRFPIAGRVSMDFLCVNLGNSPAAVGDEVILLGEDGQDSVSVSEMAQWAGTIPYEIVTRLSSRLPRIYLS